MTESEAIKRCEMLIKGFSVNHATYEAFAEDGKGYPTFNTMKEFAEACKYALEEVEQYRAIGTVEEVKALKDDFWKLNEMCRHYSAIGTVEELKAIKQWKSDIIESFSKYDVNSVDELMKKFKEMTEKAEPKKPRWHGHHFCPNCNSIVYVNCGKDIYCPKCGQRLDWE